MTVKPRRNKAHTLNNDSNRGEGSDGWTISRRTFLGISAGAAAAIGAAYAIKWPKFTFPSGPAEYGEGLGEEIWLPTSCLNCPTRCAVNVRKVRIRNEDTWHAVRIIGNPESQYSDGKACPRSHVGLQVLYNPERIRKPLRRKQGEPKGIDPGPEALESLKEQFEEVAWEDALSEIAGKLQGLDAPQKLLVLQGLNTSSDEDLIARFAEAFGTVNLMTQDALELDASATGQVMAVGRRDSGYDLEKSNYILAFSANIVGSERPLARNIRAWGKIRRERPVRARVVVADPRYSVTAAKADEWLPIEPGSEGALAMAIANVILNEGLYDKDFTNNWTSGFDEYKAFAGGGDFKPERVAESTGVSADTIRRIAREFAQTKPAIAWTGPGATSWPHGTYASHAIYCLNALVGSIDAPGGITFQELPPYKGMPALGGTTPGTDYRNVAEHLIPDPDFDVAIGFNSNLIMSVPQRIRWNEALAKENLHYYHVGSAWNEMAAYADIILPACTYLEEWAYETAIPGSGYAEAKIKQPVIGPLYGSRPTAQIIFDLAAELGSTVQDAFKNIGDNPEGFVRYRTGSFVSWDAFKKTGVWTGAAYEYAKDKPSKYNHLFNTATGKFEFHTQNLGQVLSINFVGDASHYPHKLMTYKPVLDIRNGNQNYPWAQEIFLVMQGRGWNNFVDISAHTADELKVKDGSRVVVETAFGEIEAQVKVLEGLLPGVVAIASGQGHYACGEWADGIGVNPNDVTSLMSDTVNQLNCDTVSGQPCFSNTLVKIRKA